MTILYFEELHTEKAVHLQGKSPISREYYSENTKTQGLNLNKISFTFIAG